MYDNIYLQYLVSITLSAVLLYYFTHFARKDEYTKLAQDVVRDTTNIAINVDKQTAHTVLEDSFDEHFVDNEEIEKAFEDARKNDEIITAKINEAVNKVNALNANVGKLSSLYQGQTGHEDREEDENEMQRGGTEEIAQILRKVLDEKLGAGSNTVGLTNDASPADDAGNDTVSKVIGSSSGGSRVSGADDSSVVSNKEKSSNKISRTLTELDKKLIEGLKTGVKGMIEEKAKEYLPNDELSKYLEEYKNANSNVNLDDKLIELLTILNLNGVKMLYEKMLMHNDKFIFNKNAILLFLGIFSGQNIFRNNNDINSSVNINGELKLLQSKNKVINIFYTNINNQINSRFRFYLKNNINSKEFHISLNNLYKFQDICKKYIDNIYKYDLFRLSKKSTDYMGLKMINEIFIEDVVILFKSPAIVKKIENELLKLIEDYMKSPFIVNNDNYIDMVNKIVKILQNYKNDIRDISDFKKSYINSYNKYIQKLNKRIETFTQTPIKSPFNYKNPEAVFGMKIIPDELRQKTDKVVEGFINRSYTILPTQAYEVIDENVRDTEGTDAVYNRQYGTPYSVDYDRDYCAKERISPYGTLFKFY